MIKLFKLAAQAAKVNNAAALLADLGFFRWYVFCWVFFFALFPAVKLNLKIKNMCIFVHHVISNEEDVSL